MESYDVVVIGAGTAGLKAADVLKKHGASYLVIEKGEGGTLCADTGCMPSKALIEAANAFHSRKKFDGFGIAVTKPVIADIPSVLEHVRSLRDKYVENIQHSMKEHPVLRARASFIDHNTLQVEDQQIKADQILICTGSKPRIPSVFENIKDDILTTDTFFEQKDLPQSLAVIGMGRVGAEMSQALARLGLEVFAIEPGDTIAGISDPEVNDTAQNILQNEMRLYMKTEVKKAEQHDNVFSLTTNKNIIQISGVLVSAGRIPNVQDLGLQFLDIPLTDEGIPELDPDTLQVKDTSIYITGDINNNRTLQHEAADEGERAANYALGLRKESLNAISR